MRIYLFSALLIILFTSKGVNGQDSVYLFLKKEKFFLPLNQEPFRIKFRDSLYIETIISLEKDKYFYLKQQIKDTLTVEAGQLELYKISNKFYLLRKGNWILEESPEKILFGNLGKIGFVEEIRIDPQPDIYEGDNNRKKKSKKIRSVKP